MKRESKKFTMLETRFYNLNFFEISPSMDAMRIEKLTLSIGMSNYVEYKIVEVYN